MLPTLTKRDVAVPAEGGILWLLLLQFSAEGEKNFSIFKGFL